MEDDKIQEFEETLIKLAESGDASNKKEADKIMTDIDAEIHAIEVEEAYRASVRKEVKDELKADEDFRGEVAEEIIPPIPTHKPADKPLEPTNNQELIELGKRLGKDIRKALLKLDDDMKSSAPRRRNIACLLSLQMIKQNLNTGRVFNPKSPSTTLIWSNGDSLEDSIGELSEELEL